MKVECFSRKGFEIVFADDKTLVRTNLQVFLLSPTEWNYSKYIEAIRVEVELGNIKDWNELYGMFKHHDRNDLVVQMIAVQKGYYI